MNTRRLVVALLAALAISGLCTLLLGRKIAARGGGRARNLHYVAVTMPIAAGEVVKPDEVDYIDWPAGEPLSGSFTRAEDVIGRSVIYPLERGQPILASYLAAAGSGFGLTNKIPQGRRAIALKSDEVVGVAGFLFPGSRVDVLVTYHSYPNPNPMTATVLQDAQVVAVGHQIQPDPAGKPTTVDVVTILADPADAEKVVLASTQGSIHFLLRNATDRAEVDDPPAQMSQFGGAGPVRQTATRKAVAEIRSPKPYVVETILGDKETSTSFN